ncbi:MAG: DUF1439 domain-containing protein [Idiomarina sp.]|nr:DUF1439 domain-containing protein [Idiomarina sp.]
MLKSVLLLSIVFVGTACAQIGQLVNYTIGENELERLAMSEIEKHRFEVNAAGVSARLNVDDLGFAIDEHGDGKVHVRTNSVINASFFGREYPVKVFLQVAGVPSYSAADHAIYVRRLSLESSSIDTDFGQLNVSGISNEVYGLLHDWLEENPVYRFDQEDSRYQLLQQLGLNISVEPGQIRVSSAQ